MLNNLRSDLPAGLEVFLVSLSLCLGIALALGAPLFASISAGVIGGIVVGWISDSTSGVSDPSPGLIVSVMVLLKCLVLKLFYM